MKSVLLLTFLLLTSCQTTQQPTQITSTPTWNFETLLISKEKVTLKYFSKAQLTFAQNNILRGSMVFNKFYTRYDIIDEQQLRINSAVAASYTPDVAAPILQEEKRFLKAFNKVKKMYFHKGKLYLSSEDESILFIYRKKL